MQDIYFAVAILSLFISIALTYAVRALARGRVSNARTDADRGSVFLGKSVMEMGYWALDPVVRALAYARVTPNMVTVSSLVPAGAAAVAIATGWFGLASLLGTVGLIADIIDGVLARRTGVACDGGELIDAVVDRYGEFLLMGGLAVYYRGDWLLFALVLAALHAGYMVSYTTAKAEALGRDVPRGTMRRGERAIYLLFGLNLTAFTRVVFGASSSEFLRDLPAIFALMLVAVVANVSTLQRLRILASPIATPR